MLEAREVRLKVLLVTFVATLLGAGASLAADQGLDVAKSSIIATFSQEGVPVDAPFTSFSGDIVYDAGNVAASTARIEVFTGSLDLGDETYNEEVRKKEWFDSVTYPNATFQSTTIEAVANGEFKATGELTIKGKAQTITITIAVAIAAAEAPEGKAFDGAFEMSRAAFGIGEPLWDEVLDDIVKVRFHLVSSNGD